MTDRSTDLHNEILCTMIDLDVDPFERSHRDTQDAMIFDATVHAPDLTKHEKGKVSFKYWRKFSINRKYLEAKSAKYQVQENTPKHRRKASKKPSSKKNKPETQDVRQPGSRKQCSFASAVQTRALFDSHVVGPINPVNKIYQDTETTQPGIHSSDEISHRKGDKEKRFNLKAPIVFCSGDIGTVRPGGVLSQGPGRPAPTPSVTQTASMPASWELDGGRRSLPGGAFRTAARFDAPPLPEGGSSGLPSSHFVDRSSCFKGRFPASERFRESVVMRDVGPAPGSYNVPGLFDKEPCLTGARAVELIEKIRNAKGIKKQTCGALSKQAVFAYGCSFDEHVKYGLCLDGLCAKRASWEDVMMMKNDEQRLTGRVTQSGRKFSEAYLSSSCSLDAESEEEVRGRKKSLHDHTPLKSAALAGDIDSIVKLCQLGSDINEVDQDKGQTALHHASTRGNLHLVNFLTGGSEGWDTRNSLAMQCRQLFENVINMNIQDCNGNTPLHLVAREGRVDLVQALCDAGATPDSIRNKAGRTPSEVAKTQSTFQVIKMSAALRDAENELAAVSQQRQQSESKLRRRLKTMVTKAQPSPSKQIHFTPSPDRSRHNTATAVAWGSDMSLDKSDIHNDEESEDFEGDSDLVADSFGEKKKQDASSFNSFKVGALPPAKHHCQFEHKKVESTLPTK